MRFLMCFFSVVLVAVQFASAGTRTDVYDFKMSLKVPRIYSNMDSLGSRRYQTQRLVGKMYISYDMDGDQRPTVLISNLVNRTHKINGKNITYDVEVDEGMLLTRVNLIGDNRKNLFRTPSVNFYIDANPSYNIGDDIEDNSLIGIVSGFGTTGTVKSSHCETDKTLVIKNLHGTFAGTMGCGCREYGHVSPTRVAGFCGATEEVDDVASVCGTWTAVFNRKMSDR